MIAKLAERLLSRGALALYAALALVLLVWSVGPWIGFGPPPAWRPFTGIGARAIATAVILLAWLVYVVVLLLQARRRNRALVDEIAPDPATAAREEEAGDVERGFKSAVDALKTTTFAGGRLFSQVPWYVIIGAPGSGKTTAILESGLDFVGERREVKGGGGTRRCDWFFTREAVFLDTAGRYTTQDSVESGRDVAGWETFLAQLKRYRPSQPINGVLVAVAAPDLLAERESIDQLARGLRARLGELDEKLGIRPPVYLVVTKTDVVPGFSAFFEDLDADGREQVLGFAFPDEVADRPLAALGDEFALLAGRLGQRRMRRLDAERDGERRARIFAFVQHFDALTRGVERLAAVVFGGERGAEVPWRGVFFSSGTQDGSVVDRLLGRMAERFGLPARAGAVRLSGARPYFLTRLLREVVPGEAGLVGRDGAVERGLRRRTQLAWGLSGLATVVVAALWLTSFAGNAQRYAELGGRLADVQKAVPAVRAATVDVETADLRTVLPALDALRTLPAGHAHAGGEPLRLGFGLSQFDATRRYALESYHRASARTYLPRLLLLAEREIRGRINDTAFVFDGLKAYLLLGQRHRLLGQDPQARRRDTDHVLVWFDRWVFDGVYTGDERERLLDHLDALLAMPGDVDADVVSLNRPLVEQARERLAPPRLELHEHVFELMRSGQVVELPPPWRFSDAMGTDQTLFRRASDAPIGQAVEGIFTRVAFYDVVQPGLELAAAEIVRDAWVLGPDVAMDGSDRVRLVADALDLYYREYIQTWERQLNDVVLRQPVNADDMGLMLLQLIEGGRSPLKRWLATVREQTRLTVPPGGADDVEADGAGGVDPALARAGTKAASKVKGGSAVAKGARLAGRLGDGGDGRDATAPRELRGARVERHFAYLDELVVGADGAPPRIDRAIAALGEIYQGLLRSGEPPTTTQLQQVAARMPAPVDGQLLGLADVITASSLDQIRERLRRAYAGELRSYCREAMAGRFPFDPGGAQDVRVDDFKALFRPGGRIASFFDEHLRPHVDTSARTWRWAEVDGQPLGLGADALDFFQRAARIRDGLFALGGGPAANFQLGVRDVADDTVRVRLDLDGQELVQDTGPFVTRQLHWPGPGGQGVVRVSFTGIDGTPTTLSYQGFWAWFHLLGDAEFAPTESADRFGLIVRAGGRWAEFELIAASVVNPFDVRLFAGLRCPDGL